MIDEHDKITINELKKIQIKILDDVANFCKENEINYWLDSGTLLGAVRHKGYIPWDDDIDIGMLREDYDKFIKLYNKKKSNYELLCYENNKNYYYPFGKIIDKSTVLYEPNQNGIKSAVNIDLFVYDNAPLSIDETNKLYDKRDMYNYFRFYQHFCTIKLGFFKTIYVKIMKLILFFFPNDYFVKKMIINSKKNILNDTGKVGNFTAVSRIYCDKKWVKELIKIEFEGKKYYAPRDYDKWLTAFYGDYMKLPPEEKRVGHHYFEAYYVDSDRNDYN